MINTNNTLDDNENISYDAQQVTEEIELGEQPAPDFNFDAAYEAAKAASVPSDDVKQVQGDEVAPQISLGTLADRQAAAEEHAQSEAGNPESFLEMAREITS